MWGLRRILASLENYPQIWKRSKLFDKVVIDLHMEGIDFFVVKCFLFIMDFGMYGFLSEAFLSSSDIPEILSDLFDSPQKGDATEEFDDFGCPTKSQKHNSSPVLPVNHWSQ